jgi:predicted negative regulator of RcsB-dependent stress response
VETNASEREQLDEIRKWWNANGKAILVGLTLGLAALFGYRYWQGVQESTAESASINYQHFLQIAAAGPSDEARTTAKAIMEGYQNSVYARLTALLLARLEVDDQKLAAAKPALQWVIDHGKNSELAAIARSRLAQVLLAEGDAKAAMTEISKLPKQGEQTLFAEIRGDIFAALNQRADALAMYTQAIAEVSAVGGEVGYLEIKRDALGVPADSQLAN